MYHPARMALEGVYGTCSSSWDWLSRRLLRRGSGQRPARRLTPVAGALLAAIALTVVATGALGQETLRYKITGCVTDGHGAPLAGVSIEFSGGLPQQVTDVLGCYEVAAPDLAAQYTVTPSAPGLGFEPQAAQVWISSGDAVADFVGRPEGCPAASTPPEAPESEELRVAKNCVVGRWSVTGTMRITILGCPLKKEIVVRVPYADTYKFRRRNNAFRADNVGKGTWNQERTRVRIKVPGSQVEEMVKGYLEDEGCQYIKDVEAERWKMRCRVRDGNKLRKGTIEGKLVVDTLTGEREAIVEGTFRGVRL